MSATEAFPGFPALSRATAIPNVFFATALPDITDPAELLAFLWVSQMVQARRAEPRYVDADELWASGPVRRSFEHLGGGQSGLERGLAAAADRGLLLVLRVRAGGNVRRLYFVNNPSSQRVVARARTGEAPVVPGSMLEQREDVSARPGIFRLYEENVGTITPLVGERLVGAAERYPAEWIEDAFREAAELNVRNWRYVERMLQTWEREGRADGATRTDSLEDRKRRFLGGTGRAGS